MNRAALLSVPALAALMLAFGARAAEPAEAPVDRVPEPAVERTVVEDEGARVEELRVRGETQQVVVQTKGPLRSRYEIVMPRRGSTGGAAGQRVWHVLSF